MDKSFYKLADLIVFLTIVDEVYQVKVLDYEMIFFPNKCHTNICIPVYTCILRDR